MAAAMLAANIQWVSDQFLSSNASFSTGLFICFSLLNVVCKLSKVQILLLNSVQRRQWVHPYNLDVHERGEFFITYPDLRKYSKKFFRTYRMSVHQFDNLLHLLPPVIKKNDNNYRESISAEERLVITVRYVNNYNQFDVDLFMTECLF